MLAPEKPSAVHRTQAIEIAPHTIETRQATLVLFCETNSVRTLAGNSAQKWTGSQIAVLHLVTVLFLPV